MGVVKVLDSFLSSEGQIADETVLQICNIYTSPDRIEIRRLKVQQQIGSIDCGLFAIAFATELCEMLGSLDLEKVIFKQTMMRQHLEHCIRENRMEVFPMHILPLNDLPVPDIFHIELFCYCKMPDIFDEFMVQCSSCEHWFHFSCVGFCSSEPTDN